MVQQLEALQDGDERHDERHVAAGPAVFPHLPFLFSSALKNVGRPAMAANSSSKVGRSAFSKRVS